MIKIVTERLAFRRFKNLYEACGNNDDKFIANADILFALAKQLPADKIMEPMRDGGKWHYFHYVCRYTPEHALEIIEKLTPEQIYKRVDTSAGQQMSPLRLALAAITKSNHQIGYDLIKAIIKKANLHGLNSVDGDGKTDLEIIRSFDLIEETKAELIELYEARLNGKIFSLNAFVPSMNYPMLPNIVEMIDHLLNSGKASDATRIGQDLSRLVQSFTNSALQTAQQSFVRSADANAIMEAQIQLIRDFTKSVTHFGEHPTQAVNPNMIVKAGQSLGALPKPSSLSEIRFTKALESINQSLESSVSLLEQYEAFDEMAPKLNDDIQTTLDEITRGIDILNSKEQKNDSDQRKLDILSTIRSSIIRDTLLIVAIKGTSQFAQNIEVEFWRAGVGMRDMINASMVNTSLLLTKLKAQSSGRLSAENESLLREQLQSIADTGQAFIEIAEQRKQDIGNMKIEMIPLRLPMQELKVS